MMARPIVTIAAVDVQCPKCHEFVAGPGGSLYLTADEYVPGTEIACDCCGTVVTLPPLKSVRWSR